MLLSNFVITPPIAVTMLIMFIKTAKNNPDCIPSSVVRVDLTILVVSNLTILAFVLVAICIGISTYLKKRKMQKAKEELSKIYTMIL